MSTTLPRTPVPATGPGRPPAAAAPGDPGRRPPAHAAAGRRRTPRGMPGTLWLLLALLAAAALAWGALTAWTVSQHAAAAGDVVSASEPLSLDAQRMYQALSDADVTATTAFLAGPQPPLAARQRYQADITQAATELTALKSAAARRRQPAAHRRAGRDIRRAAQLHRLRGPGAELLRTRLPAHRRLVHAGRVRGDAPDPAARRAHRLRPGERPADRGQRGRDRPALGRGRGSAGPGDRRRAVPRPALARPAHPPDGQLRAAGRVAAARGGHHLAGRRVPGRPVRSAAQRGAWFGTDGNAGPGGHRGAAGPRATRS